MSEACTGGQFHQLFTHSFNVRRSQKRKKLLELTVFLALLGSAGVKDVHKMLVKLTLAEVCEKKIGGGDVA